MSIESEIARLQNAKEILKAAINNKLASTTNITNETLDEYASFVDNITTGGGGINPSGSIEVTENGTYDVTNYASALVDIATIGGTSRVTTGTFTISEDCEEYTFSELDFKPDMFLICAETMGQGYVRTAMWLHSDILKLLLCYKNAASVSVTTVVDSNSYTSIATNSITIKRYLTNNILAGNYKYIAIKN